LASPPNGRPISRFKKGEPRPPGAGRKKGVLNRTTVRIRDIARGILEDPDVQKKQLARIKDGTEHPAIVTLLYHYAYGKPPEKLIIEDQNGGTSAIPIAMLAKMLTGDQIAMLIEVNRTVKALQARVVAEMPDGTEILDSKG